MVLVCMDHTHKTVDWKYNCFHGRLRIPMYDNDSCLEYVMLLIHLEDSSLMQLQLMLLYYCQLQKMYMCNQNRLQHWIALRILVNYLEMILIKYRSHLNK